MKKKNRRDFLKHSIKVAVGLSLIPTATNIFSKTENKMNLPNILYIHSHDTGRYTQPYGQPVPTPNLQKLAEQGTLFRQNFCVGPTCSPSRAGLLTGCYPHENGMFGLSHLGFSLYNYKQHIIHTLRKKSYYSVLTGIQHIAYPGNGKQPWQIIGYDKFLPGEQYKQAAKFLETPPQKPFFLSVGFFETHRVFPKLNKTDENPAYTAPPVPLPDCEPVRQDFARFKESAKTLDEKIGIVLNALKKSGLKENTLVICTTDHGIAFPGMKCNLYDSGIGTMLIIRARADLTAEM